MAFDGIPWRAAPLTSKSSYLAGGAATSDALFNALVAAYARERVYARLVACHAWPRFEQVDAGAATYAAWAPVIAEQAAFRTIHQADVWISDTWTHARGALAYESDAVSRQSTITARMVGVDTTPTTTNGSTYTNNVNEATTGSGSGRTSLIAFDVSLSALDKNDNITLSTQLTCEYATLRLKWLVYFLEVRD